MDRHHKPCLAQQGIAPAIAILVMSGLAASPATAADNKKQPLQFAFHVDVLKNTVDAEENASDQPVAPTTLNLVGVPLTFGSRQVSFEDGPGLAASLYADYEALLSDRTTFTARAALSKTKYMKDGWGNDEASASGTWRYRDDTVELALEPGWRITMQESEAITSDYGANFRVQTNLGDDLSVINSLRYRRYDTRAWHDDRSEAGVSSGVSYRFGPQTTMNVTFDAVYTLSQEGGRRVTDIDDLRDVASNMGPTVSMAFPLSDEIEFAAAYRFCRSTDELPRFSNDNRRIENEQHLDMRLAWRNKDPMLRDVDISAGYAFDGLTTTGSDADTADHTVTVALAVSF